MMINVMPIKVLHIHFDKDRGLLHNPLSKERTSNHLELLLGNLGS